MGIGSTAAPIMRHVSAMLTAARLMICLLLSGGSQNRPTMTCTAGRVQQGAAEGSGEVQQQAGRPGARLTG